MEKRRVHKFYGFLEGAAAASSGRCCSFRLFSPSGLLSRVLLLIVALTVQTGGRLHRCFATLRDTFVCPR